MGRFLPWLSVVLLGGALSACGGGGGSSGPDTQQFILGSTATLDGVGRSDGTVEASGGGPATGDFDGGTNGLDLRQFFSFYVKLLPPGATVVSATLRIYQQFVLGAPYTKLGDLLVDHHPYQILGPVDYAAAALTPNIGTLSSDASSGYKDLDVTAAVQADIAANRDYAQFRVRFAQTSNSDNVTDLASLTDAENSANSKGGVPLLVVNYRP